MPAYDRKSAKKTRAFARFKKYFLRGLNFSVEKMMRCFFSKAQGTIVQYTRVIKSYVKYMIRRENSEPFPITESSLRRYIGSLSLKEDRGKFPLVKPAVMFVRKLRDEPLMSFNSTDLILEGLLREAGALFRPKIKPTNVNELNIRKFLLRCLYGRSFKAPYNNNLAEFRTGLRCLTSLFCLSRCADFMELKRGDIEFDRNNLLIHWRKRKNNQRSKMQQSLVPQLPDNPLCLFSAFEYFFERTQLEDGQFVNCKMNAHGIPYGDTGIAASTCYANIKVICTELEIDQITEKMCKAVGTRYMIYHLFNLF